MSAAISTGAAAGRAGARGWHRRRYLWGYLFISPWLIGFVVFTAGPFLASLLLSLTSWDVVGSISWTGLSNYERIFTRDPRFSKTLGNTAYYVLFHVPGVNVLALACALLLNQKLRGIAIYRTLFYMPSVTSGVATAVLWIWIFNGQYGVVNSFLRIVGVQGPNWLFDLHWSMPALIIMSLWGMGNAMLIYLAGLQNVPQHLYEAAMVDGAGVWQRFVNVTLPLLTPTIFYNLVIGIIASFQVFTAAFVMTGGGPADSTLFYVLYLYRVAFENLRMGYAAALAWILFVIIIAFTILQFVLARRWVYYEGASPRGTV
jgi:ABC-type sugar transport system permease subunit